MIAALVAPNQRPRPLAFARASCHHHPCSGMTLAVGDTLGQYKLLARLRAGGMATLFLGKRVGAAGFARPVAIKVIHAHLAEDPRFVQMFVDEAMLSAKVHDPCVVHVEELGEANGTYFLVMEYVDGASLAELLRGLSRKRRALTIELAVWIAAQVAAGLHAAHEATDESGQALGIVHRDVSPHNVLLAFKGHVKLIDFGVAKARGRPGDTQTGSLRGKIAYMPPEQAFGRSVDRRADVYALGVVLWEMLTMRRLFEADNDIALLEQVRRPVIAPPSELMLGIPPALDEVVMAALAADPSARPATAEEFRARLVAAVPTAGMKTASDVAAVIGAAMPETIQSTRDRLADVLGEPVARESEEDPTESFADGDILATMTVTLPDAVPPFEQELVAEPIVRGTTLRSRRRTTDRLVAGFVVLAAVSVFVVGIAIALVIRRPPEPLGAAATGVDRSPTATETVPSTLPTGSNEHVPPAPTASTVPTLTARTVTFGSAASPARSPHGGTQPRRPKKASPHPSPSSSIEMHEGTPIFKKDL